MNDYLTYFPPFGHPDTQRLAQDELIDIIENSVPNKWRKNMTLVNFDPVEHSLQELQEFCERMETMEEMDPSNHIAKGGKHKGARPDTMASHGKHTTHKGAKSSEEAKPNYKNNAAGKWCEYHKTNSHSTGECKVVLNQAKCMRKTWEHQNSDSKHHIHSKKKEMYSVLESMVKDHMGKNKKKASNKKDDSEEDDPDSTSDENFGLDLDNYISDKAYNLYTLSSIRNPKQQTTISVSLAPITIAHIQVKPNNLKIHKLKALLDTGASANIIAQKHVKDLAQKHGQAVQWTTKAGTFTTNSKCPIKFSLPEFFSNRIIEWTVHVDGSDASHRYDIIIGRDILEELKLSFDFATHTVTWDNASVQMKDFHSLETLINNISTSNSFYWKEEFGETNALQSATDRIKKILDAKYEKACLEEVTQNLQYLNNDEQQKLLILLKRHQHLFDGTLRKMDWSTI